MYIRLLFILCTILLFTTCKKVNTEEINNLNGGKILIIGHGGSGGQTGRNPIPTNSFLSVEKALEIYAADGVEVDIQLSKDSVVMLYHNELMESNTHCLGCISDYPASELTQCRYRKNFPVNTFLNEKLITLESLIQKYQHSDLNPYYFLDNKDYPECIKDKGNYYDLLAISVAKLISKYNLEEKMIVEASGVDFLVKVKQLNPSIITYLDTQNFEEGLDIAIKYNLNGIIIPNKKTTKDQVKKAHASGIKVGLVKVRDRENAYEAISKHPDLIQTDNIKLLHEFLK